MKRPAPTALAVPAIIVLIAAALAICLPGCGGKKNAAQRSGFSGERAMKHVEALVGFGPRPAGSEAIDQSRDYIEAELLKVGWFIDRQEFTKPTKLKGRVKFVNLRARYVGPGGGNIVWTDAGGMVVVGSHYDTKWFEDFEFVGANDGGSSTGALIELARVLGEQHPDIARKVELVFFDGEEAFGESITATDGLYGSHYYARALWRPRPAEMKPSYGIVLDMIGDKDLLVTPPTNSGSGLVQLAIDCANDLGYGKHFEPLNGAITDDHVPLDTEARFPSTDLIDFSYEGVWHTKHDTLERISPDSLEIVGNVTIEMVKRLLKK